MIFHIFHIFLSSTDLYSIFLELWNMPHYMISQSKKNHRWDAGILRLWVGRLTIRMDVITKIQALRMVPMVETWNHGFHHGETVKHSETMKRAKQETCETSGNKHIVQQSIVGWYSTIPMGTLLSLRISTPAF